MHEKLVSFVNLMNFQYNNHLLFWKLVMGTNFFKQGMMVEFAKNLADFAVATGMNHVLVLSSLEFMRLQKIDTSRYSNH
jgi:hypothetical protein